MGFTQGIIFIAYLDNGKNKQYVINYVVWINSGDGIQNTSKCIKSENVENKVFLKLKVFTSASTLT